MILQDTMQINGLTLLKYFTTSIGLFLLHLLLWTLTYNNYTDQMAVPMQAVCMHNELTTTMAVPRLSACIRS
jgi:hypothetical protein